MTNKPKSNDNQTTDSSLHNRFISAYGPKRKVVVTFVGEGKTKQSFKDECDINKIMARFQQTGLIDFVNNNQARYLDCDGIDYQNAQNIVAQANSMFQQLPSGIRTFFENDPGQFVEFCSNPENLPEMHKMGLTSPDYNPGGHPTTLPSTTPPTPPVDNPQGSNITPAPSAPGT